jgi:hypothetical protein
MFAFNNTDNTKALDARIAELLEELDALSGSDEEYSKTADNLAKLLKLRNDITKLETDQSTEEMKIRIQEFLENGKHSFDREKFAYEKEKDRSWKPSPDAVIGAAASIVGILAVLHYEKLGVVTSKALGFIGKMK